MSNLKKKLKVVGALVTEAPGANPEISQAEIEALMKRVRA